MKNHIQVICLISSEGGWLHFLFFDVHTVGQFLTTKSHLSIWEIERLTQKVEEKLEEKLEEKPIVKFLGRMQDKSDESKERLSKIIKESEVLNNPGFQV